MMLFSSKSCHLLSTFSLSWEDNKYIFSTQALRLVSPGAGGEERLWLLSILSLQMWERTTSYPEGAPGDGVWVGSGPGITPAWPDLATTWQTLQGHTGEGRASFPLSDQRCMWGLHEIYVFQSTEKFFKESLLYFLSPLRHEARRYQISLSAGVLDVSFPWSVCAQEYH